MKTRYKFIHFESMATRLFPNLGWKVVNNKNGDFLGTIQWYPAWKQYAFITVDSIVFSTGCLVDILDFIRQLELRLLIP